MQESVKLVEGSFNVSGMAAAVLVGVARAVLTMSGVTVAVVGPESAASLTVSLVHASPKAAIRAPVCLVKCFYAGLQTGRMSFDPPVSSRFGFSKLRTGDLTS